MCRLKMLVVLLVFFLMISVGWAVQSPSLLAKPPMAPSQLIHSFEDLLGRQEGLLHSFEMLVGHFDVPPVELLKSFEDLLHRQAKLLHSYEELAHPYACMPGQEPQLELVASFEKLLLGQAKLLGSFEALVHRHAMPPVELGESFEHLLRGQTELLHSFEHMLHCLVKIHGLPPRALYRFTVSFEVLLRSQAELLQSFESLLKQGSKPMPGHSMDMPHMMPPQERPEEAMLPSLEELKDFALRGKEMVQRGHARELLPTLMDLADRLSAQLKKFKQEIQMMRAHGEEAERREAQLAEFRGKLTRLQSEILKHTLVVEMTGMADAPGTFQITVQNRGPFGVTLATVLLYEGQRMIYSQSLGYLEPGARRALTVRVDATTAWMEVRGRATGFIDLITKLMALAMNKD